MQSAVLFRLMEWVQGAEVPHDIRARLSDYAWRAWDRVATREGVTITALIEALGEAVADETWKPSARVLRRARQIDRERRSR